MKKLTETPIGNTTTFRPTEAEKLVLLNIADMQEQGRTVTQQDAVNVPKQQPDQANIGEDNLEAAFTQLVKLQLITVNPDQSVEITTTGRPVVDEAKKAQDQEALTQQDQKQTASTNPMQQPSVPGQEQQPSDYAFGFGESFSLIRDLNDLAKLLE